MKQNFINVNLILNQYLGALFCFITLIAASTLFNAQTIQKYSSLVKEPAIYISRGATVYDNEKTSSKNLSLPKFNSNKNLAKKYFIKSKKERLKKNIDVKNKETNKKANKFLHNPLSPDSPNGSFASKNSKIATSSNNIQNFYKFQNTQLFSISVNRKFVSKKLTFCYKQDTNYLNFSEIFSVRPPPVIS